MQEARTTRLRGASTGNFIQPYSTLSDIRSFDITVVVKRFGAKTLYMKLRRRFGVREGSLIGVSLTNHAALQSQRVCRKTVGVELHNKLQCTNTASLSRRSESA